jgi:2-iminobutanoate/2-iminopropanoate deaminase
MTAQAATQGSGGGPIGPYSPVRWAGDWLVCSGQLGLAGGELVPGGVLAELDQAIDNLTALLAAEGLGLGDVVKTTVLVVDLADFDAVNERYAARFDPPRPARTTFAVAALPKGAAVEVEAWARRSSGHPDRAGIPVS